MSITEKSLWIVFIQIFVPQCSLRDSPYIFHRHCIGSDELGGGRSGESLWSLSLKVAQTSDVLCALCNTLCNALRKRQMCSKWTPLEANVAIVTQFVAQFVTHFNNIQSNQIFKFWEYGIQNSPTTHSKEKLFMKITITDTMTMTTIIIVMTKKYCENENETKNSVLPYN